MQIRRTFVVATSIICWSGVTGLSAAGGLARADVPGEDSGDPAQWRRIALERALSAAGEVDDPYRRAEVFASIARSQAVTDDPTSADAAIHKALEAAQRVPEAAFRGWVLNDIVQAQIAADDLHGARETAGHIEAARPQSAAFASIARVQLRSGNVTAALDTTRKIRNASAADEVRRDIVVAQCARGELKAARETMGDIRDKFYEALATGDIAVAEVRRGNLQAANSLATHARRADRSLVYGRITLAQFAAGSISNAVDTLQKIDDPLHRAAIQGRMAAERAIAGDAAVAHKWFQEANSLAESVPDRPRERAMTLAQLGRLQAAVGEMATARDILARAKRIAVGLPRGEEREQTFDYIARGQARAGDSAGALETAGQMNDRIARALLVRDVITLQPDVTSAAASAGAAEFADPLIEAAAQFGVLGVQLLKSGQPLSASTIDAARFAVRRIDDTQLKPAAFSALAIARIRTGDIEASKAIFEEALAAADALERDDQRAAAYVRVVNALNDRLVFLGRAPSSEETPAGTTQPH